MSLFSRTLLPLGLVILFALFVFTYHLTTNPPGFFIDESIYGYEAFTLLHTGHSSNGELLPRLLLNPGESVRNHTLFAYFVIPFIFFFGPQEFSVRLTSVVFSLATIPLLYWLARKSSVSPRVALFTLAWWPLISWVFLISRVGMEFIACTFFYTCAIVLFYKSLVPGPRKKLYLTWFGASLIVLFFVYAAGKVLSLGLWFISLAALMRQDRRGALIVTVSLLLALLFSASYLLDGSFYYRADELTKCSSPAFCFVANVLTHFDPRSYFAAGYTPPDFSVPTHSITATSLIPAFFAPFLVLGLVVIFLVQFINTG